MYDMDGLEKTGPKAFIPTGRDIADAAQGGLGLIVGAAIAKWVANGLMDYNLTKETDDKGVTTYKAKVEGSETEVVLGTSAAGTPGPAVLDQGRGLFGGQFGAALPGLAPVLVGLAFYAKSSTLDSEDGGPSSAQVWLSSSGLGMIAYGLGHSIKSVLERVNIDYSKKPASPTAGYGMKDVKTDWAAKAAAYLPFGGVDTYESNIVINGLGNMGVSRYMRGNMNGLGMRPTFVNRVNGLGRAPAEIQTLAPASSPAGVSAAPQTITLAGLSASLM